MSLSGEQAYALSKGYVEATANSLGAVIGAPCTIKNTTKLDGETIVTFEWTGTNGNTQSSQISIMDGISPTMSMERTPTDDGIIITITNPDGTTSISTVYDGKGGGSGEPIVEGERLIFKEDSDATVVGEVLKM